MKLLNLSSLTVLLLCVQAVFAQSSIADKQFAFEINGDNAQYSITFSNETNSYSNGSCSGYEQVWSAGCSGNNPSCEDWGCFTDGSYDQYVPDQGVCEFVGGT